jgi:hypothetical protein
LNLCQAARPATTTRAGPIAGLDLWHCHRRRREDRIRTAKDTGLGTLPVRGFAQNQIWCSVVALAW